MTRFRQRTIIGAAGVIFLICAWWYLKPSIGPTFQTPFVSLANPNSLDRPQNSELSWPQFRGPTFDGVSAETEIAEFWPSGGPPVLWTRELGQGYSSFAAVGNKIFTQTQSLYQQSVVCLNADTGATIWAYNCGWPYEGGGLYPGPRSTPTWSDGRLYFATPDGLIGCLNAADGQMIWSQNPKKQLRGRGTDFGYACSPVVIQGRVIVPVGGLTGSVVALDAVTGTTVWMSGESPASYATPLPIMIEHRMCVVTPLENSIAAFDVESGTRLWEIECSEGYDEHSAAPIYREPYLVMAAPFRAGAKCFSLATNHRDTSDAPVTPAREPKDTSSSESNDSSSHSLKPKRPTVKWESPKFSNDVASSVLYDERLYGFDLKDPQSRLDRPSRGEFRCLDFETGRIIWSSDKVGQANLIVAEGKLILFNDRGELILARSGTDEYVELSRTSVFRDEVCWTPPALHHGRIYLRTQTRAACLYLGTAPLKSSQPSRSVSEIPRGRSFDAKWLIGGEREFPATAPQWNEFGQWFRWSLAVLFLAEFASLLVWSVCVLLARRLSRSTALGPVSPRADFWLKPYLNATIPRTVFWVMAFLGGLLGSPIINHRQSEYVFLWPFAVWVAFQVTMNVITWTEHHLNRSRWRWVSRFCGLIFIGVCFAYFHFCRGLGYAIEWSFLIGFLPAFPLAALAARVFLARRRYWPMTDLISATISFSAYYWACVVFIQWRLRVGS